MATTGFEDRCSVANMPGAVSNTSTDALTNVTVPCAVAQADRGAEAALAAGLNVHAGRVTHRSVSEAHRLQHTDSALTAEEWGRRHPAARFTEVVLRRRPWQFL